MSALDQVVSAIQNAISGIENAEANVAVACGQANDAIAAAQAFGAHNSIAATENVKKGVETLSARLDSVKVAAQEVLAQTISVRDGD
ncbi:MAG: hypothetical protein ACRDT8_17410 [Micromonosporaceae bacterium]